MFLCMHWSVKDWFAKACPGLHPNELPKYAEFQFRGHLSATTRRVLDAGAVRFQRRNTPIAGRQTIVLEPTLSHSIHPVHRRASIPHCGTWIFWDRTVGGPLWVLSRAKSPKSNQRRGVAVEWPTPRHAKNVHHSCAICGVGVTPF